MEGRNRFRQQLRKPHPNLKPARQVVSGKEGVSGGRGQDPERNLVKIGLAKVFQHFEYHFRTGISLKTKRGKRQTPQLHPPGVRKEENGKAAPSSVREYKERGKGKRPLKGKDCVHGKSESTIDLHKEGQRSTRMKMTRRKGRNCRCNRRTKNATPSSEQHRGRGGLKGVGDRLHAETREGESQGEGAETGSEKRNGRAENNRAKTRIGGNGQEGMCIPADEGGRKLGRRPASKKTTGGKLKTNQTSRKQSSLGRGGIWVGVDYQAEARGQMIKNTKKCQMQSRNFSTVVRQHGTMN